MLGLQEQSYDHLIGSTILPGNSKAITMYSILNKKVKTSSLLSGHRRRQNTVSDCLCGGNKCLLIKQTKEPMLDFFLTLVNHFKPHKADVYTCEP